MLDLLLPPERLGAAMNGENIQLSGLVLLTMLVAPVYTGNILVFPVDGSHWINMKILIEALHAKGHNITVLRASDSWYIEETSSLYTSISLQTTGNFDKDFIKSFIKSLLEIIREGSLWARLKLEKEMWDKSVEMIENERKLIISITGNHELMQSLRDAKYDLFITDPVIVSGVILSHYLKLPLVFNVRWTIQGEGHFAIAPSPLSYVPLPMLELSDRMSFFERVKNIVMYIVTELQIKYFIYPTYNELCKQLLGPDVNYFELFQRADLWLFRVDFIFEFPRPTMPNAVYMGGFHCKPSKALPQHLEDFVQSSGEHGVIIMSLGTFVEQIPYDVADSIAEAFAELPQKVIWRYKGERPSTVGNNTLIMDWIPQNDLLGHPKTRVFVAHGGTNGIQEAIYHGVPIVGFGLVWDQPDNLAKMRVKGVAKNVNFATVDKESFLLTVKEVLHNPSYRENMQRLSRLHRDVPIKPLDNAVFWIEYIIRHGGAAHLRTEAYKMPWYSYHSVDVVLFLLFLLSFIGFTTFVIIRHVCCRLCVKKQSTK
ncbi:UDP-glucuronosyltransferase 2C1-like isoform X2 [Clarias gariepinus]|uniref:UDP-glucuronosyltransferase 2C1-like isoform X2 n=1 Tax=Clarias gariepinus TaxID=13013 RepID=UPI00234DF2C5|nr:UDP-glucuronosyltransferase 2C1-like isoform X2 [Clarias gariepinus]